MNEKIETTGGEHNAKKPIKIYRDNEWNTNHGTSTSVSSYYGVTELELTLSEALRVVEAVVKFINKQANDGLQQQIRTNRDKENQSRINHFEMVASLNNQDSTPMTKEELSKYSYQVKFVLDNFPKTNAWVARTDDPHNLLVCTCEHPQTFEMPAGKFYCRKCMKLRD